MAALAVAAIIAAAVEALRALAPALLAETYADTVMLVARGAVAAELALPVLQQPSLPVALLAALVFAIALEYRSRRESLDVVRTT
jgi:actin-like ATPase involved in cell morphogenesis